MSAVDAILTQLLALHPKLIDLSLDRIERLLAKLDHPERKLAPVIHVAGTNGKGSTIAYLRAILEAAGLRVHVYTSPHLVRFNERIRLAHEGGGRLVDDDALSAALAECERANAGEPITLFEITTAAAFLLFAQHPADVVLLETGLGGRLDATNVLERPLATVITSVSLDHAEYLGTSITQIAGEKAGILRAGVPAIVAPQSDEARGVIARRAERLRAPLWVAGEQWHVGKEHGRLVYQDEEGLLDLPAPRLIGRHQFDNAGAAIAAIRASMPQRVSTAAFEEGIAGATWPARMQRVTHGDLVASLPSGAELWIDGGHNPDGARAVTAVLADLEERVPRPLALIVGMLNTKDNAGFIRHFAGLARRLIAVPIPGEKNAVPANELAAIARECGIAAEPRDDLADAFAAVRRLDIDAPRVLIAGSLYLAGHALAANSTPPQ